MFSIWDFPSAFLRPRLSTYYDVKNVYSRGVLGTIFWGVDPILGNHEVQSPSPRSRSRSPELSLHRSEFWAAQIPVCHRIPSQFFFTIDVNVFELRTLSNGRQSSGLNFFHHIANYKLVIHPASPRVRSRNMFVSRQVLRRPVKAMVQPLDFEKSLETCWN